jgi:hypothetical protein
MFEENRRTLGGSPRPQKCIPFRADNFDERRNSSEVEQSENLPGDAAEYEVRSGFTGLANALGKRANAATINNGNFVEIENYTAITTDQIGNNVAEGFSFLLEYQVTPAIHDGHRTRRSRS